MKKTLPLVYSCSGCSSAAQMANQMALWLDRNGVAEMSCIAGVGGGVTGLVGKARAGQRILALDGCMLVCVSACLKQAGVKPDSHVVLSTFGVKKRQHADFDPVQAREIYQQKIVPVAERLAAESPSDEERNHDRS